MADEIPAASSALFKDVAEKIRYHRHPVGKVYRVYSAGESGTGDTTVLFTDFNQAPKTAFLGCEAMTVVGKAEDDEPKYRTICVVVDGWDLP